MDTFTWKPDFAAQMKNEPTIRETKFGDGYAQRGPNGINSLLPEWSLAFGHRTDTEADAIDNFLATQGGWQSFLWTPPKSPSVQKKFVCKSWNVSYDFYNSKTVTAIFIEVP